MGNVRIRISENLKTSLFLFLICASVIGVGFYFYKVHLYHLSVLAFLPVLLLTFNQRCLLQSHVFFKALFFAFFYYVISLIWAEDLKSGVVYIVHFALGFYVVWAVSLVEPTFQDRAPLHRWIFYLFLLLLGVSLLESYVPFQWPISRYSTLNSFFGVSADYEIYAKYLWSWKTKHIETYEYMIHQPSGVYWEPNRLAVVLVLLYPFAVLYKKSPVIRSLLFSATLFLLVMLCSRSALAGFAVVHLFFLIFFLFKREKVFHLKSIFIFTGTAILFLATHFPLTLKGGEIRYGRLLSIPAVTRFYVDSKETQSARVEQGSVKRKRLMQMGLDDLVASRGLGVGAGNSMQDGKFVFGRTNLHNFWVEILVEAGVLFTLLMLGFLLGFVRDLFNQAKRGDLLAQSSFLGLLGFVPACLALGTPIFLTPFWLVLGVALRQLHLKK